MAITSFNSKEIFKELSLFDHPSNESSSSYELFCRTTIQLEEDNLFNFIRMKFSRNISPENEKELFFDSFAQKRCQLIINDSREFSHKVLILIRKNITSSNLKVIFDFISQNFDQIIHNNEKQFLELELKLTFEYRHNILTSLKVDLLELEKIFNPYEILDWEFECFIPLFSSLSSVDYSFVFSFIFNSFKNPVSNNVKF
jgi:hypothetical protein